MIDFLWHLLLGIGIGAYFFNSNVRSGVNDIIKKIAVGLSTALNEHYNGKQRKAPTARQQTSKVPNQTNVGYKTNGAVKSLVKNTGQCQYGCGGIVIPANGQFKGFGVCANCNQMQELKK